MTTPQNPYESNDNSGYEGNSSYDQNNTPYGAFPGSGDNAYSEASFGGEKPNNYMAFAIIETILSICSCCIPIGAIAIFYSIQVDKHFKNGDIAAAQKASAQAKKAVIVLAIVIFLSFIIVGVGNYSGVFNTEGFVTYTRETS